MEMTLTKPEPTSPSEQRLWLADQADRCVKWLKSQGLEVLYINRGAHPLPRIDSRPVTPRIYIKASPLCGQFEGVTSMYERGMNGERRYKMVMRHHCEVRWVDGGAA